MKKLLLLALLAMACTSCVYPKTEVVTMKPTKNELDPQFDIACVVICPDGDTYTVDGSGCVG
jgi:hypothetical protein